MFGGFVRLLRGFMQVPAVLEGFQGVLKGFIGSYGRSGGIWGVLVGLQGLKEVMGLFKVFWRVLRGDRTLPTSYYFFWNSEQNLVLQVDFSNQSLLPAFTCDL